MFILSDTQYVRGSILLTLGDTQYFIGVDTSYTKKHAVFSWGGYCLYSVILSIFGGWIRRLLGNAQYYCRFDLVYTKQYAVFSGVDTAYTTQCDVIL